MTTGDHGPLRLGICGLETSHPFIDAHVVRDIEPGAELFVMDERRERIEAFVQRFPGVVVVSDLEEMIAFSIDGALISQRPEQALETTATLLDAGVACSVTKPAVTTMSQLRTLDAIVAGRDSLYTSGSVLRFSSRLAALKRTRLGSISAASVTVRHSVESWLNEPARAWQDAPDTGGGLIAAMGTHGLDILVDMLGPDVTVVSTTTSTRHLTGLRSEDTALIHLRWANGILGTIEVLGATTTESYRVRLVTVDEDIDVTLAGDAMSEEDPLGFRASMLAFIELARNRIPATTWSRTRAVLAGVAVARGQADLFQQVAAETNAVQI